MMPALRRTGFLALLLIAGAASCSGLSTSGTKIYDGGSEVTLIGANYFGFNNGQKMLDGFWKDQSDGFVHDLATILYRWQLLGFNSIRLPFSFSDLDQYVSSKQSSCTLPSTTDIAYSVTDPNDGVMSGLSFPPPIAWPTSRTQPGAQCNDYLPNSGRAWGRFVWVVQYLARNGFYVIIDCHTEDSTPTQFQAGQANMFVRKYTQLLVDISADPVAANRIIVDILNEPDARGWGWDKMTSIYLETMDALWAVNQNALLMVEGCGQGGINNANWGDGFQTTGVAGNAYADPNPFFTALLSKPYVNNVVISPHVYGPSVTGAWSAYYGQGLWDRMTASFGYLTTSGYNNKKFPIVIGEVGSRFTDSRDLQFLPDFRDYLLNNVGYGVSIPHIIWWSWNENSGDTGGLVDSSWQTLMWQKLRYLHELGLTPWYTGAAPAPGPTPDPEPVVDCVLSDWFDTTACTEPCGGGTKDQARAVVTNPSNGGEACPALTQTVACNEQSCPTPGPEPEPAPMPNPGTTSCVVRVYLGNTWSCGGADKCADVNLWFKNLGPSHVSAPWTFNVVNPGYMSSDSQWNFKLLSISGGIVTGQATSGWQQLQKNGGNEINVGFIVKSSGTTPPTQVYLSGNQCALA